MLLWAFEGVQGLIRDNITEHPSTINVLSRMNIYQEVLLAAVYRLLPALHVNITLRLYVAFCLIFSCFELVFSALTPLVGHQEEHLACKN